MVQSFFQKIKKDILLGIGCSLLTFLIGGFFYEFGKFMAHSVYWWFTEIVYKHPFIFLFGSIPIFVFIFLQKKAEIHLLDNKTKDIYHKSLFGISVLGAFFGISVLCSGLEHIIYHSFDLFSNYKSLTEIPEVFSEYRKTNPKASGQDIFTAIEKNDFTSSLVFVSENPLVWQETLNLNREECLKALKSDTFKKFDVFSINNNAASDDQCTNYFNNSIIVQNKPDKT